jgi:hypothetical protein
MDCDFIAAYAASNKNKSYGIDCDMRDTYGRDLEKELRAVNESLLLSQNEAIETYSPCTVDCNKDIFYSHIKPYSCANSISTVNPNNLNVFYERNYTLAYGRGIMAGNNVEIISTHVDLNVQWNNSWVSTSKITISPAIAEIKRVSDDEIFNFTSNDTNLQKVFVLVKRFQK